MIRFVSNTFNNLSGSFLVVGLLLIFSNSFSQTLRPCGLVFPKNQVIVPDTLVTFVWEKTFYNNVTYRIQVADDINFTAPSITIDQSGLALPTFSSPLSFGIKYYWRVRVEKAPAFSLWSYVQSFTLFSPKLIPGLSVWLDPSKGVTLNGTNVSAWKDRRTGGTNDAGQIAPAQQPFYISKDTLVNNRSLIKYDGTDDFLEIQDDNSIDFQSRFSMHVMVRPRVIAINKTILAKWDYQTQGSWAFQTDFNTSDELMFAPAQNITDAGNDKSVSTNADLALLNYYFLSVVYNGNLTFQNRIKYYRNFGILNTNVVGSPVTSLPNSTATLKIGKYGGVANRYYNGDIGEIIIYNQVLSDSLRNIVDQYLRFKYSPPVNLGNDTSIGNSFCNVIKLKADFTYKTYLWSNGSTASSLNSASPGKYWVTVTDQFNYVSSDTITVYPPFNINTPITSIICPAGSIKWATQYPKANFTFLWQDGSTDSVFNMTQQGKHYVKITDASACSFNSDTIDITIDNFPNIASLGNDTNLCIGNPIYLQVGAAQASSYVWSDGSTNDSLPILIVGQYSVTATTINGCVKKDTINITIAGVAPTANFSITSTCFGTATQFLDASSPPPSPPSGITITSRSWDFGDLSPLSSVVSPSHVYADTGSYTATLTVTTNVGCSAMLLKKFTIHPYPKGSFTATNLCERNNVLFTKSDTTFGYSITQWSWNFAEPSSGANNISSNQNPSHIYANAGIYPVSLTIQNAFGCATTINNSITIKPSPVTDFNYSLLCEKKSIAFTDNTPSTIALFGGSWNFGDGSPSTILINTTHTYSVSGTYTVAHVMTYTNSCSNTMTKTLTINSKPTALYATGNACVSTPIDFTDTSLISSGSITAWRWTFGAGGPTSTLQHAQHTFNTPVSPQIKLLITSDQGCKDSITKTIIVRPLPVADFTYTPDNGAPPLAVTFTNTSTGAATYAWDFGDTNTDTQTNTSNIFVNVGSYNVSLIATTSFSCTDTILKIVEVLEPLIDVAVQTVTAVLNNNFLTITAQIVNKGTIDVTRLQLTVRLNDGTIIQENWTGLLLRGGVLLDTIGAILYLKDTKHFVCVAAIRPNNQDDENPSDNESCIATDKSSFEVLQPYPVPAGESITLAVLIPNSTSNLEVNICNARGQTLRAIYSGIVAEGLQLFKIDLTGVAHGFYAFTVTYEGKTVVRKFVID